MFLGVFFLTVQARPYPLLPAEGWVSVWVCVQREGVDGGGGLCGVKV